MIQIFKFFNLKKKIINRVKSIKEQVNSLKKKIMKEKNDFINFLFIMTIVLIILKRIQFKKRHVPKKFYYLYE